MPHVFSDSREKRVVREKWNTPFLRHLHDNHGYVYRYFGLPGPEIIDIKLWRDMITDVVAFEIPNKTKGRDERTYINDLRRRLELLGVPNTTYYGSFEEVLLLRKDFDGQDYFQQKVITLYNLDFCSEIGSKITQADGQVFHRLEAIRRVIRDQVECFNKFHGPPCFIVLLTVRNQMHSRVLKERLEDCRNLHSGFINECLEVKPVPEKDDHLIGSHTWALKTMIHTVFEGSLIGNNVKALFFPLVKYEGVRVKIYGGTLPSPMLHLMIFCKFQDPHHVAGTCLPDEPLRVDSLSVSDESLIAAPEPGENNGPHVSSVAYFEAHRGRIFA